VLISDVVAFVDFHPRLVVVRCGLRV